MSDDLVKRLREDQPVTQDMVSTMQCDLQNKAADRIEALEAQLTEAQARAIRLAEVVNRILVEAEAYREMGFLDAAQSLNMIAGDVLAMKEEETK